LQEILQKQQSANSALKKLVQQLVCHSLSNQSLHFANCDTKQIGI